MGKYFAGVDVGSWNTKVVIVDEELEIVGKAIIRTGTDLKTAAEKAFAEALKMAKLKKTDIKTVVSTGFGRNIVAFADLTRTEITCHGLGANFYYPASLTVIDIGGQDTKVLRVDDSGHNLHFVLNRKCAAGTGAFLQEMAFRLNLKLEDLNDLATKSTKRITLGSFCTVFTGTETLKLVQDGEKVENIARALYRSIVLRVTEMGHFEGRVVLTGGVIEFNPILKDIFEEETEVACLVPPDPQFIGALGAARAAVELPSKKGKNKKKEK
jgi:(R)-2-hydroxyacyl-CoA dehydratese activating ATPase